MVHKSQLELTLDVGRWRGEGNKKCIVDSTEDGGLSLVCRDLQTNTLTFPLLSQGPLALLLQEVRRPGNLSMYLPQYSFHHSLQAEWQRSRLYDFLANPVLKPPTISDSLQLILECGDGASPVLNSEPYLLSGRTGEVPKVSCDCTNILPVCLGTELSQELGCCHSPSSDF